LTVIRPIVQWQKGKNQQALLPIQMLIKKEA